MKKAGRQRRRLLPGKADPRRRPGPAGRYGGAPKCYFGRMAWRDPRTHRHDGLRGWPTPVNAMPPPTAFDRRRPRHASRPAADVADGRRDDGLRGASSCQQTLIRSRFYNAFACRSEGRAVLSSYLRARAIGFRLSSTSGSACAAEFFRVSGRRRGVGPLCRRHPEQLGIPRSCLLGLASASGRGRVRSCGRRAAGSGLHPSHDRSVHLLPPPAAQH